MTGWLDKNLVILTGAGISAESGIRTFRDSDGLWENHAIEDVATPEAFARNPELVHQFYNLRRAQLLNPDVKPNKAHQALAELEKLWRGDFLLISQNVDNLHARACSEKIISMHGQLQSVLCQGCGQKQTWQQDLSVQQACPRCGNVGSLRPDIVWFGEMPLEMARCQWALECADLFISIGTSGNVYPAAAFVRWADNAHTIEVNAEQTALSSVFSEHRSGTATVKVPELVRELIDGP